MQHIWRTLCLANGNVMQIGRHLVWQIGLIEANSNSLPFMNTTYGTILLLSIVVLNSRDRYKKYGMPLLRSSITYFIIYFTQNELKYIGNTIIANTFNTTKIQLLLSIESF